MRGLMLLAALAVALPAGALEWDYRSMEGRQATCIRADDEHARIFVGTIEGFHYLDIPTGEWTSRDWEGWIGRTVRSITGHREHDQRVITGRVNAFFKGYIELSDDLGETEAQVCSSQGGAVNGLATDPDDADRMYACTWHDVAPGEVLRSSDGGETWTLLEGTIHYAMTSIVTDIAGAIFVGGDERVTRSLDGGETWETARTGLPDAYGIYCLAADPEQTGHLFASNDIGLYETQSSGASWSQIHPASCRSLATSPTILSIPGGPTYRPVAAATWDERVLLSLDGGRTWEDISGNLAPAVPVAVDVSMTDRRLYVATTADGVFSRPIADLSAAEPPAPGEAGMRLHCPRPIRGAARFEFRTTRPGPALLEILDVSGRWQTTLLDRWLPAGNHTVTGAVGSRGVHFGRLRCADGEVVTRMVVLR